MWLNRFVICLLCYHPITGYPAFKKSSPSNIWLCPKEVFKDKEHSRVQELIISPPGEGRYDQVLYIGVCWELNQPSSVFMDFSQISSAPSPWQDHTWAASSDSLHLEQASSFLSPHLCINLPTPHIPLTCSEINTLHDCFASFIAASMESQFIFQRTPLVNPLFVSSIPVLLVSAPHHKASLPDQMLCVSLVAKLTMAPH